MSDTTMPSDESNYELDYCKQCGVMTNHLNGRCMKSIHPNTPNSGELESVPSDEELRQEIKKSGLYLEWAGHTDVPQSEHDRWIDVIISIVNGHSAKAFHEAYEQGVDDALFSPNEHTASETSARNTRLANRGRRL